MSPALPFNGLIDYRQPTPPAGLTVGGKAQGLYQLRRLGLPVPGFVVIPAEVFDPVLAGLGTTEADLAARGDAGGPGAGAGRVGGAGRSRALVGGR
ncbi:hypothetical protein GCM10023185_16740 [Hymenobacter saemangeumensis]|uniref:Pyruvate phosphate dikinase AMP/ATP-binding domain-containing protein n=1 Tax=Hymenobacter saemangeumensis TaxID=1084522 RepID=A0ABP8IAU6_9BACT